MATAPAGGQAAGGGRWWAGGGKDSDQTTEQVVDLVVVAQQVVAIVTQQAFRLFRIVVPAAGSNRLMHMQTDTGSLYCGFLVLFF